jgi:hypothetical protein
VLADDLLGRRVQSVVAADLAIQVLARLAEAEHQVGYHGEDRLGLAQRLLVAPALGDIAVQNQRAALLGRPGHNGYHTPALVAVRLIGVIEIEARQIALQHGQQTNRQRGGVRVARGEGGPKTSRISATDREGVVA